jgi:hypothetical protein
VLISNALPVKFWLSTETSYNNKEVCGVTTIPFCQPFQCDDEISIQFTDESDLTTPQEETIAIPDFPALTEWTTQSVDPAKPDWTEGAAPTVNIIGSGIGITSEIIFVDYAFLPGYDYEITIEYTRDLNEAASNPRTGALRVYDDAFNTIFSETLPSGVGANTITISFTADADCTKLGFSHGAGSDVDITIDDVYGTRTGLEILADPGPKNYELKVTDCDGVEITSIPFDSLYLGDYNHLYSLTLIPSDEDICDESIKLKIIDVDASPDDEVASTDCLSIATAHACTLQIAYTNSKNFAGIYYPDASPDPTFYIRIPAIFFEEDNPAEQEDHELSSGDIVRLYNKLERRRKLDIGFLPAYLHEKIQLILMHDTIIIDELEWIRRDAYEKTEGNKRYPLKRASVFLHDKNFIKENQL